MSQVKVTRGDGKVEYIRCEIETFADGTKQTILYEGITLSSEDVLEVPFLGKTYKVAGGVE